MFIKVWCEYDICGSFGGNNNEEVYEVNDDLSEEDVDALVEKAFAYLFEEVKEEGDESFLSTGLLNWEVININKLGE